MPAESARERLVEAAIEALGALATADLLSAVGTREIARRAGTSSGTLFYHFGSVEDLAEAVVQRLFDPGHFDVQTISDSLDQVRAAGLPVDAALAHHASEFDRLTHDPEIRLRFGVWALGGAALDPVYKNFMRSTEARVHDAGDQLFASWGREIRPPYDPLTFHAAQIAFLHGSTVTSPPRRRSRSRCSASKAAICWRPPRSRTGPPARA